MKNSKQELLTGFIGGLDLQRPYDKVDPKTWAAYKEPFPWSPLLFIIGLLMFGIGLIGVLFNIHLVVFLWASPFVLLFSALLLE